MLRHDKILKKGKLKKHLAHVPAYLVPKNTKVQDLAGEGGRSSMFGGPKKSRKRKGAFVNKSAKKKKDDPLHNFSFNPSKKAVRAGLGKRGKGKGEGTGVLGTFSREFYKQALRHAKRYNYCATTVNTSLLLFCVLCFQNRESALKGPRLAGGNGRRNTTLLGTSKGAKRRTEMFKKSMLIAHLCTSLINVNSRLLN